MKKLIVDQIIKKKIKQPTLKDVHKSQLFMWKGCLWTRGQNGIFIRLTNIKGELNVEVHCDCSNSTLEDDEGAFSVEENKIEILRNVKGFVVQED